VDLAIRGGIIAGPIGTFVGDIGVHDGRIATVCLPGLLGPAATELSAEGCYVVPGGVDPHVHTALKSAGTTTLDDFFESTKAAAFGGTTTIVDFAIPDNAAKESPAQAVDRTLKAITGSAAVDVALHACVTRCDERSIVELRTLLRSGLPTLKMFSIYRGDFMLEPSEMHECLKEVNAADAIALIHCESPHIIEPLIAAFASNGETTMRFHALSRPPAAEIDMVQTIIELLRVTGAMGYVVHVSTPEAIAAITRARSQGVRVWAETCPQYVFLDDSRYVGPSPELFVCSPPLRDNKRRAQLWRLLLAGEIAMWGSDHCAYDSAQKTSHNDDFRKVPNGLPGVETRGPLLFSRGVSEGLMTVSDFVLLTATNPARFAGLYPRKGSLAPGADADVAIYDPQYRVVLSADRLHMHTDYTPFDGIEVAGLPRTVLLRGQMVIDDRHFVGKPGMGEFVRGKPPQPPFSRGAAKPSAYTDLPATG
jgi:dihydropyrimidinase